MDQMCCAAPVVIKGAGKLAGIAEPMSLSLAVFAVAGLVLVIGAFLLYRSAERGRFRRGLLIAVACGFIALLLVSERIFVASDTPAGIYGWYLLTWVLRPVAAAWLLLGAMAFWLTRRPRRLA